MREAQVDIDRRRVLVGTVCTALTAAVGRAGANPSPVEVDKAGVDGWHPLTRSLLERAQKIGRGRRAPDGAMAEQTIRQFAAGSGWTKPLVIKWMDTPTYAFDHLSRFGIQGLLDMGTASFWRRVQPPVSRDEETFDRAFEVRMAASELLAVGEHDRSLMAPKLLAKSQARSARLSDREFFRVRAVSSQIGWLETSMADVAAQAVANVDLLLSTGTSEGSVAIDHQFKIFESYEHGLLATWETTDALICVPRIQI
jgi:hypothetical protein